MKALRAASVSALLFASGISTVYAEAPLAAGRPAGVQTAAMSGNGFLITLGLAAVIAGAVSIATMDNNKGITSGTATATSTGTSP